MNIQVGDKVRILNTDSVKPEEMKILVRNNYICTVEEIDCFPCTDCKKVCKNGVIWSIYVEELTGFPFTDDDIELIN